ncbi:MAG: DoxX family protein [Crocinitomicaceae bacterium]|nr:DoxX family protein [Crocinitomicaceae bacterium]
MSKGKKIVFWVVTLWLSLGMVATGIVQLIQTNEEKSKMIELGIPNYIFALIGIWKIIGVAVILIPKCALIKEWAYAGFFFLMSGATVIHLINGSYSELFGPILLLVLTISSWLLRPESRKLHQLKQATL